MKRAQAPEPPVSYAEQSDSENLRRVGELNDAMLQAGRELAEHLRHLAELMGPPAKPPRR